MLNGERKLKGELVPHEQVGRVWFEDGTSYQRLGTATIEILSSTPQLAEVPGERSSDKDQIRRDSQGVSQGAAGTP